MAKATQIVCQHLENISRSALVQYQDLIREYIRGRHGIYALYHKGKLHYVGLANNLRVRLKQHLHDRHQESWDRFSVYLTIDNNAIKELETLLLRIVNPGGNIAGGRFVRSENLAVRLKNDIRKHHRELEIELVPVRKKRSAAKLVAKATEEGTLPPLAKYTTKPFKLRARFRGKWHRATVTKMGRVRYDGVLYNLPSKAAAAAVKRVSCSGWQFWHYERAPGDWVPLRKLRE